MNCKKNNNCSNEKLDQFSKLTNINNLLTNYVLSVPPFLIHSQILVPLMSAFTRFNSIITFGRFLFLIVFLTTEFTVDGKGSDS